MIVLIDKRSQDSWERVTVVTIEAHNEVKRTVELYLQSRNAETCIQNLIDE